MLAPASCGGASRRCSVSDAEWEKRSAVRTKEIAAVGEAIGILTDDDAHDLFHKSLSAA